MTKLVKLAEYNGNEVVAFSNKSNNMLSSCYPHQVAVKIGKHAYVFASIGTAYQATKLENHPNMIIAMQGMKEHAARKFVNQNKNFTVKIDGFDVMKNLLRTKFELNSELTQKLKATGGKYIVEHDDEKHGNYNYWSDNFDGSGNNNFGQLLMIIRGERGGVGVVNIPKEYNAHVCNKKFVVDLCIVCNKNPKNEHYQFCGKTCGKIHSKNNKKSIVDLCINCNKYPKNEHYEFCGRICGNMYSRTNNNNNNNRTNIFFGSDLCTHCKQTPKNGKYDYCSTCYMNYKQNSKPMQSSTSYIPVHQVPKKTHKKTPVTCVRLVSNGIPLTPYMPINVPNMLNPMGSQYPFVPLIKVQNQFIPMGMLHPLNQMNMSNPFNI